MASSSQHRCVFVGNIPYDATEEQLIQICEEVGPVVSFRLVIDRETGKPKGYGFCEYKDEETALSARRNLQGYEINGRQLRVDFAENDKNLDRNREQGRGGPGMAVNADPQKQVGGPAVLGDSSLHQPIGLSSAMAAASIMKEAVGGEQIGSRTSQNGLPTQPILGADPLTLHLAKMSRNLLNKILSDMKVLATKNKEQARQLLLTCPQLAKALFLAEIMLGMVPPQMLKMPNIRQVSAPSTQPLLQDGQRVQQPAVHTFPGLPPLAQKIQLGSQTQGQASSGYSNSLVHNQYVALPQLSTYPRIQLPQPVQNQILHQGTLPWQSGVSNPSSVRLLPMNNVPVGPQIQVSASSSVKQQAQSPFLQHAAQVGSANLGQNAPLVAPSATIQPSLLTCPPVFDKGFQPSLLFGNGNKDSDRPQVTNDSAWSQRVDMLPRSSDKAVMGYDNSDAMSRPSKLAKLDDGRGNPSLVTGLNVSTSVSRLAQVSGMSGNQVSKAEETSTSDKQVTQLQLPPGIESALLQQVLNLTPEQLSSLSPDQQQQVIQLQQMLRQPT